MEKKFELTDVTIDFNGHTLHRIRALKSFHAISKGELGGYVESEDNLSHYGNCWVYNNAKVYEEARVTQNAFILEAAQVFGKAHVGENSQISNNAMVYGNARVFDSIVGDQAQVFEYAHIDKDSNVHGCVKVYGLATVINSYVVEDSEIFGKAFVQNAEIRGDAKIGSDKDYIVFKNNFSSGRFFTWTRSNNKWSVGCFYGTGEELVERAFIANEKKGRSYKAYVDLVEKLCEIVQDTEDTYEIVKSTEIQKYMRFEGFENNSSLADDADIERYGLNAYYVNKKWKEEIDKQDPPEVEVVTWPEIQDYMHCEGFNDNCTLANSESDVEEYGSSAYYVNREWKRKMDEQNETGL